MALILDAYNVLLVTGVLPPDMAGIELPELVELIAESRYAERPVCLVCDGAKRPVRDGDQDLEETPLQSIRVVYAGRGRSADDVILSMVERSTAPRRLTVVTQDRELAAAARRFGCRIIRSDAFLSRLAHDASRAERRWARRRFAGKPNPPLSAGEVDAWLRIFGLADRELSFGDTRSRRGGRNEDDVISEASELDMNDVLEPP